MTCFLTKLNPQTDPNIILGYPILVKNDKFGRLFQNVIPEILSLEGF